MLCHDSDDETATATGGLRSGEEVRLRHVLHVGEGAPGADFCPRSHQVNSILLLLEVPSR